MAILGGWFYVRLGALVMFGNPELLSKTFNIYVNPDRLHISFILICMDLISCRFFLLGYFLPITRKGQFSTVTTFYNN